MTLLDHPDVERADLPRPTAVQRMAGLAHALLDGSGPCECSSGCSRPATVITRSRERTRALCADCAYRSRSIAEQLAEADAETRRLDQARLIGHVATFACPRRASDGTEEVVSPGAFRDAIRGGGLELVVDHDRLRVVASQRESTLQVEEDAFGLFIEAEVSRVKHRELAAEAGRGTLRGSFSFLASRSQMVTSYTPARGRRWELHRLDVIELSLISSKKRPAYRSTWIGLDTASSRARARELNRAATHRQAREREIAFLEAIA